MNITRVRAGEMATPLIALEVDGALYDAVALERRWGLTSWSTSADFHARVFGARAAGLDQVDARLRSGDRPRAARILGAMPLPPCDPDRTTYVQLGPPPSPQPPVRVGTVAADEAPSREHPHPVRFVVHEARSMLGDGHPVPLAGGPHVGLGFAALLGDDLYDASPREVKRGVLGFSLLADWTPVDRWRGRVGGAHDGPTQLGPGLVTRLSFRDLDDLVATIDVSGRRPRRWTGAPVTGAECAAAVSWVTRAMPLRAGDVVGLPPVLTLGPDDLGFGDRITLSVEGRRGRRRPQPLHGWAVAAPPL
ncbi:MAG: fumarylacetoacetate hydrolase family protein [Myxococcota bacterium]